MYRRARAIRAVPSRALVTDPYTIRDTVARTMGLHAEARVREGGPGFVCVDSSVTASLRARSYPWPSRSGAVFRAAKRRERGAGQRHPRDVGCHGAVANGVVAVRADRVVNAPIDPRRHGDGRSEEPRQLVDRLRRLVVSDIGHAHQIFEQCGVALGDGCITVAQLRDHSIGHAMPVEHRLREIQFARGPSPHRRPARCW